MLFVVDTEAARTALHAGRLTCPRAGCGGRLHPWGTAKARTVLARAAQRVELRPDRGRCGSCRVGQTLLPAWYVPARSCGIEVVGAALIGHLVDGHGHARVAAGLGLASATVRSWLRGAKDAAGALYGLAHDVTTRTSICLPAPGRALWPLFDDAIPAVVQALGELAQVAVAFTRPDPPHATRSVTGIDYIHLLGQQARRDTNQLLRLVDPTEARPALGVWPAINVISGGRLLALTTARTAPAAPG